MVEYFLISDFQQKAGKITNDTQNLKIYQRVVLLIKNKTLTNILNCTYKLPFQKKE